MPITFDYKCTNCGEHQIDLVTNTSSDTVLCPICNHEMTKLFSGFQIKKSTKHHTKLPSNYKFSKGGANFGKLSDL